MHAILSKLGELDTDEIAQVAQSEADSLRMDLAEAQTTEAALRSTLGDTEGQVRRSR